MTPDSSSRPSWASRNYALLTGAAVVTSLGANGSLIAAALAVLDAGGDAGTWIWRRRPAPCRWWCSC